MITKSQIEELNKIIIYLNQSKVSDNIDLVPVVEDIEFLLSTLAKVEVTKVQHYLNNYLADCINSGEIPSTRDSIIRLFETNTTENILRLYTLHQLQEMYFIVYKKKPLSNSTKGDIVYSIKKMVKQIERVAGFRQLDLIYE